jgi:hypothetical protein
MNSIQKRANQWRAASNYSLELLYHRLARFLKTSFEIYNIFRAETARKISDSIEIIERIQAIYYK